MKEGCGAVPSGKEGRGCAVHSHGATEQEVMRQMQERALYRQVNECVCVCVLLYGGVEPNSFCLVPLRDPVGPTLVKLARWGQVVLFCICVHQFQGHGGRIQTPTALF